MREEDDDNSCRGGVEEARRRRRRGQPSWQVWGRAGWNHGERIILSVNLPASSSRFIPIGDATSFLASSCSSYARL
jgi:hypothetical protein